MKTADQTKISSYKQVFSNENDPLHEDGEISGFKTVHNNVTPATLNFSPKKSPPFGFPYAYLQHYYFTDDNSALVLLYSQGEVIIKGRNLMALYVEISRYRVTDIYATEKGLSDTQTEIESITVNRYREVQS